MVVMDLEVQLIIQECKSSCDPPTTCPFASEDVKQQQEQQKTDEDNDNGNDNGNNNNNKKKNHNHNHHHHHHHHNNNNQTDNNWHAYLFKNSCQNINSKRSKRYDVNMQYAVEMLATS